MENQRKERFANISKGLRLIKELDLYFNDLNKEDNWYETTINEELFINYVTTRKEGVYIYYDDDGFELSDEILYDKFMTLDFEFIKQNYQPPSLLDWEDLRKFEIIRYIIFGE